MIFKWFCWWLVFKIRFFKWFKPKLRQALTNRAVRIDMVLDQGVQTIFIHDGKVKNKLTAKDNASENISNVQVTYRSYPLVKTIFQSAHKGDNFWLQALRDKRIEVKGDLGVLIWFFAVCRHLPII